MAHFLLAWQLLKQPLPADSRFRAAAKSVRLLARAILVVTVAGALIVASFALMLVAEPSRWRLNLGDLILGIALLVLVSYAWCQFAVFPLALLYGRLAQADAPRAPTIGVGAVLLILSVAGPVLAGLMTMQKLGEVAGPSYVGAILWTATSPWLLKAGWSLLRIRAG